MSKTNFGKKISLFFYISYTNKISFFCNLQIIYMYVYVGNIFLDHSSLSASEIERNTNATTCPYEILIYVTRRI